MHRIARYLVFVVILVAVAFAPHYSTAHAAAYTRVALPGSWVADVTFCTDGFYVAASGSLVADVTTTVSVLGASPASDTGSVFTFTGPGAASGSAFFGWQNPQKDGKVVSVTLDRSEEGLSLTGGIGRIGYGYVEDCVLAPYGGPVLPPPDERNLVLVVVDTPILDAPGGMPTDDMLNTCQTAFVIDNNNGYGEIFIMGGWINLAHTVDVAEDYGQPGGTPVAPGCAGQ
jgi:hypothetical protein